MVKGEGGGVEAADSDAPQEQKQEIGGSTDPRPQHSQHGEDGVGMDERRNDEMAADDDQDRIEEAKVDVAGDEDGDASVPVQGTEHLNDDENHTGTEPPQPGAFQQKQYGVSRLTRDDGADEKLRDPEAGAELLDKRGDSEKNGEIDAEKQDEKEREAVKGFLLGLPKERLVVLCVVAVLLLIVFIVVVGILASGSDSHRPTGLHGEYVVTTTTCGLVQGLVQDGALAFLGLPYAVPPVGARRWKPSELAGQAKECWTGTYQAHNHSKLCYQKPLPQPYGDLEFSEDCLYLDIYTPRVTYNDPMSVVVYFAGDSFQGHDVMDFTWRPSARLAKEKQVVFVVVYYRTNAFGFLALELLTRNTHPPTSGNYGLHDMLTALSWVRSNIESFGGSSTKVTVFGHGSGATGILALISSTVARKLFTQAWITGGSAHFVNKTLKQVERNNEAFNRHLICETTECLYSKTPEQILAAIPTSEWPFWGIPSHLQLPTVDESTAAIAVVDGAILQEEPTVFTDDNDFVDVTLVIGSSLDSVGSHLMDEEFENFGWEEFSRKVRYHLGTFGADVATEAIERYYDENSTALEQYVRMVSDVRVTCPLLELAYRASKAFSNNVYFYVMSHVPDSIVDYMNLSQQMAVHGLDVAAIFGRLDDVLANPSERDLRFQSTMQSLFYQFVEEGRPTRTGNPKMPWQVNWVSEDVNSTMDLYPNYEFWTRVGVCPKWGRTN